MAKMKTQTKLLIGAVVLAGAGVAGYFGWKKYQESKDANTSGLGAFTDGGYADYNARVAHRYWRRMNQMQHERLRLQSLRGY
jgi:outer membrane murein-binding lipoprotein Lpp